MNTISVEEINGLLVQGYEVFTVFYFNSATYSNSCLGHVEYQTMKKKDGIVRPA